MVPMNSSYFIEASGLSIGYEGKTILQNIDLKLDKKQLCCVLGANGIGKSTLLKTLSGIIPAVSGDVKLDQKTLGSINNVDIAKSISIVINNQRRVIRKTFVLIYRGSLDFIF